MAKRIGFGNQMVKCIVSIIQRALFATELAGFAWPGARWLNSLVETTGKGSGFHENVLDCQSGREAGKLRGPMILRACPAGNAIISGMGLYLNVVMALVSGMHPASRHCVSQSNG